MITGERTTLADLTTLSTVSTGVAAIGDTFDLTKARDIGAGWPVYLIVQINEPVNSVGGTASIAFRLVSDDQSPPAIDGSETVHFSTGPLSEDDLVTGKQLEFALPSEGLEYNLFVGLQQEVAGEALTGGSISAFLVLDPAGWKGYADATPRLNINYLSRLINIEQVDSASDLQNLTSYSFDVSLGAEAPDRDIIIMAFWSLNAASALNSATIDGGAAAIDATQPSVDTNTQPGVALVRRRVPLGTTANVVFNVSASPFRFAIEVFRATKASAVLSDSAGAQGVTSPQNIALAVPSNSLVIGAAGVITAGGAQPFAWTNLDREIQVLGFDSASAGYSLALGRFSSPQPDLNIEVDSPDTVNGLSLIGTVLTAAT